MCPLIVPANFWAWFWADFGAVPTNWLSIGVGSPKRLKNGSKANWWAQAKN